MEVNFLIGSGASCCRRRRPASPAVAAPAAEEAQPKQQGPGKPAAGKAGAEAAEPSEPRLVPEVREHGRELPEVWLRGDRAYTVWAAPGSSIELRGVHAGPRAWRGVEQHLTGRRYSYARGHRLRRFADVQGAVAQYWAERSRHQAPTTCQIFHWA